MTEIVQDTTAMIAGIMPELREGTFAFASLPSPSDAQRAAALATFVEDEGLSLILPLDALDPAAEAVPMRCITLKVFSALDGVGLTAAVATALTEIGVPANVVAATHHDHVFVPERDAQLALDCLVALQMAAKG